jgi:ribosomal protein S6
LEKAEEISVVKKIVAEIVEKNEGQIGRESDPQKRKLAWVIKGQRNGIYMVNRVTVPAENTAEMERQLRMQSEVLKHLLTSVYRLPDAKKEEVEPSVTQSAPVAKEEVEPEKEIVKSSVLEPVIKEEKKEVIVEKEDKPEKKKKEKLTKLKFEDLDKKIDDILKEDLI